MHRSTMNIKMNYLVEIGCFMSVLIEISVVLICIDWGLKMGFLGVSLFYRLTQRLLVPLSLIQLAQH